jgi:hypothetical protein
MKFEVRGIALACAALVSACGGGGSSSSDGGLQQTITFNFPGGPTIAVPPDVASVNLVATASGGGAVTFTSNTPDTCSVNGATATLLKAGECSITATQPGGNGYGPASKSQLFVIPKNPQKLTFRNPGAQPLDNTPVTLVATSNIPDRAVTFSSSTPTVCTVSGSTLTKVGNGICTVTATQAGDDIYATTTVVKNIPIGNATSPALTAPSSPTAQVPPTPAGGAKVWTTTRSHRAIVRRRLPLTAAACRSVSSSSGRNRTPAIPSAVTGTWTYWLAG